MVLARSLTWDSYFKMFFSLSHFLGTIICIWAAIAVLKQKPWMNVISHFTIGWLALEAMIFLFAIGEGTWRFVDFFVVAALTTALMIIVQRITHTPHYSPRFNWWESDPRYRLAIPVEISYNGMNLGVDILDLNERGAFIKIFERIPVEDTVRVSFQIFEESFDLEGKVVWHAELYVTHPRGLGIFFSSVETKEKIALLRANQGIRKLRKSYGRITQKRRWRTAYAPPGRSHRN